MAEPDLGGARRGGRGDGAVRGEQEAAVDEEPTPAFASSSPSSSSPTAAGEGYGSYGGALRGEEAGLDPLQLGPAGAEAPSGGVPQDPHLATLALPLLLLLLLLRQAAAVHGRRRRAARVDSFWFRAEGRGRESGLRESWPRTPNETQDAHVNVLCDYCSLTPLFLPGILTYGHQVM